MPALLMAHIDLTLQHGITGLVVRQPLSGIASLALRNLVSGRVLIIQLLINEPVAAEMLNVKPPFPPF